METALSIRTKSRVASILGGNVNAQCIRCASAIGISQRNDDMFDFVMINLVSRQRLDCDITYKHCFSKLGPKMVFSK